MASLFFLQCPRVAQAICLDQWFQHHVPRYKLSKYVCNSQNISLISFLCKDFKTKPKQTDGLVYINGFSGPQIFWKIYPWKGKLLSFANYYSPKTRCTSAQLTFWRTHYFLFLTSTEAIASCFNCATIKSSRRFGWED